VASSNSGFSTSGATGVVALCGRVRSSLAGAGRLPLATLAVCAALLISIAAPVAAAPGVAEICTGDIDAALASHGQCVSAFETLLNNGHVDAVGFCKLFGDFGFINQGKCVVTLDQRGF
jgi:hypothetical protein